MECLILPMHDGDFSNLAGEAASAIVMDYQDPVNNLYFVHVGAVNVFDKENRLIA